MEECGEYVKLGIKWYRKDEIKMIDIDEIKLYIAFYDHNYSNIFAEYYSEKDFNKAVKEVENKVMGKKKSSK